MRCKSYEDVGKVQWAVEYKSERRRGIVRYWMASEEAARVYYQEKFQAGRKKLKLVKEVTTTVTWEYTGELE